MNGETPAKKRRKVSLPKLGMRVNHSKKEAGKERDNNALKDGATGPLTNVVVGNSHSCPQCEKTFNSPGKLQQHLYVHTGERPFLCRECEKGFSSRFKLMRHSLIHSNERRYKCSYCDRCFHRKDHLKNHLQVHNPDKKVYRCEHCTKEYNSRLSFRKHVAVHAAEAGDLECKVCGRVFAATPDVVYHLKVHAGSRAIKSPHDKKFQCDFCERRFFTRKDVKRHLVVHTGRRDFLCQYCPQRFGRKDHLVRHIKKSHGGVAVALAASVNGDGVEDDCACDDDLGGDGHSDFAPFDDYLQSAVSVDTHCPGVAVSDLLLTTAQPHHQHAHNSHQRHNHHHHQQQQHANPQNHHNNHHQNLHNSHIRQNEERISLVSYGHQPRVFDHPSSQHCSPPAKDDKSKSFASNSLTPPLQPPPPPLSQTSSMEDVHIGATFTASTSVPLPLSAYTSPSHSTSLTSVGGSAMYFHSHFGSSHDAISQHEFKLFDEAATACCVIKTEHRDVDDSSLDSHMNSTSLDININQLLNLLPFSSAHNHHQTHLLSPVNQHHQNSNHLLSPSHHYPLISTIGGSSGLSHSLDSPTNFLTSTAPSSIPGARQLPINVTPLPQFNQAFQ